MGCKPYKTRVLLKKAAKGLFGGWWSKGEQKTDKPASYADSSSAPPSDEVWQSSAPVAPELMMEYNVHLAPAPGSDASAFIKPERVHASPPVSSSAKPQNRGAQKQVHGFISKPLHPVSTGSNASGERLTVRQTRYEIGSQVTIEESLRRSRMSTRGQQVTSEFVAVTPKDNPKLRLEVPGTSGDFVEHRMLTEAPIPEPKKYPTPDPRLPKPTGGVVEHNRPVKALVSVREAKSDVCVGYFDVNSAETPVKPIGKVTVVEPTRNAQHSVGRVEVVRVKQPSQVMLEDTSRTKTCQLPSDIDRFSLGPEVPAVGQEKRPQLPKVSKVDAGAQVPIKGNIQTQRRARSQRLPKIKANIRVQPRTRGETKSFCQVKAPVKVVSKTEADLQTVGEALTLEKLTKSLDRVREDTTATGENFSGDSVEFARFHVPSVKDISAEVKPVVTRKRVVKHESNQSRIEVLPVVAFSVPETEENGLSQYSRNVEVKNSGLRVTEVYPCGCIDDPITGKLVRAELANSPSDPTYEVTYPDRVYTPVLFDDSCEIPDESQGSVDAVAWAQNNGISLFTDSPMSDDSEDVAGDDVQSSFDVTPPAAIQMESTGTEWTTPANVSAMTLAPLKEGMVLIGTCQSVAKFAEEHTHLIDIQRMLRCGIATVTAVADFQAM